MEKCLLGWPDYHNTRGSCCCNCRHQRPISAHPWNKNDLTRGPITKTIGWGCCVPDMPTITFSEVEHSMCEMWTPKE